MQKVSDGADLFYYYCFNIAIRVDKSTLASLSRAGGQSNADTLQQTSTCSCDHLRQSAYGKRNYSTYRVLQQPIFQRPRRATIDPLRLLDSVPVAVVTRQY